MNQASIEFHPDINLLTVAVSGHLSFKDILTTFHRVLSDPNYKPGMNCLWDSSNIDSVDGDVSDFHDAAELMNNEDVVPEPSRTAILVNKKNIEKYTQAFLLMSSASNIEQRIFTDINDKELLDFLGIKELP